MRPKRLELQGFASFRDRTEVDFDGCDLFVLTGPTGSGKSSVIDALGFALYGSVARYDDQRVVEPVITRGAHEAKIRLDFTVDGQSYTAVRTVRRTPGGGASTKEARLECAGQVLAGDPDELSRQVEGLLGLSFEQFTKCVLLPQGEFAEFLHAKPKVRQDILVRLLGFDFYREIARKAGQRGTHLKAEVGALDGRLRGDLANATPEAVELLAEGLRSLEALRERIAGEEPELETLREAASKARTDLETARQNLTALAQLEFPHHVADLTANIAAAQKEATEAHRQLVVARNRRADLTARLKELVPKADLLRYQESYEDLVRLRDRLTTAEEELERAGLAAAEAERRLTVAAAACSEAVERRDAIRRSDAAYHASEGLQAGDRCPICGAVLAAQPSLTTPAGLAEAEQAVEGAEVNQNTAQKELGRAVTLLTKAQTTHAGLEDQRTEAGRKLEGAPPLETVVAQLAKIEALETEVESAEAAVTAAEAAVTEATERDKALGDAEKAAWASHDQALLSVAALKPPAPDRTDLAGSWQALVNWGAKEAERLGGVATESDANARDADARLREIIEEQRKACEALGLSGEPKVAVASGLGAAQQKKEDLEKRLLERGSVEADRQEKDQARKVAEALASHLRVDKFERWLLIEALRRLAETSTVRLHELSSGQYALAVNDKGDDFVVIDHFNADEQRPVKTLSGGETFLASLSLALGLAEEVALIAAGGSGRLEALFLDEGFGTLDPDTLATVEAAIENLGAGGRMVGIVTHVRELAERIPVQFRVTKDSRSSRVVRVDM